MALVLFHQNMRRFGGGADARVRAYDGIAPPLGSLKPTWPQGVCPVQGSFGFPAIAQAVAMTHGLPALTFAAIGLTELTNEGATLPAAFRLSETLVQRAPIRMFCFNCGQTGSGIREYATIAVPWWVGVLALGRVATGAKGSYVDEVTGPPFRPEAWSALPEGASRDWRFVVYAVLSLGAAPFAVGFLHNTYSLESKTSTDLRMPFIVDRIWDNAVATPRHVFVGGDFNVPPHNPNSRRPLIPHFIPTEANIPCPFGGTTGGTTWWGSLYDYWLSDLPWGTPNMQAALSTATWDGEDGLMSDHVAIMLQIA
ncbi:MAG TPA: endonuclease/exonuclease/phosphatase family protein [Conexibacter sp.]|nr:endonuclease/exonuclease/phosphatase family protein [Conexibacter sp.]